MLKEDLYVLTIYAAAIKLFPTNLADTSLGTYAGRFGPPSIPHCLLHPILAKAPRRAKRRPGSETAELATGGALQAAAGGSDAPHGNNPGKLRKLIFFGNVTFEARSAPAAGRGNCSC